MDRHVSFRDGVRLRSDPTNTTSYTVFQNQAVRSSHLRRWIVKQFWLCLDLLRRFEEQGLRYIETVFGLQGYWVSVLFPHTLLILQDPELGVAGFPQNSLRFGALRLFREVRHGKGLSSCALEYHTLILLKSPGSYGRDHEDR